MASIKLLFLFLFVSIAFEYSLVHSASFPDLHTVWFQVVGNGLFSTHWASFQFQTLSDGTINATATEIMDLGQAYESSRSGLCIASSPSSNPNIYTLTWPWPSANGDTAFTTVSNSDPPTMALNYIPNTTIDCFLPYDVNTNSLYSLFLSVNSNTYPSNTLYVSRSSLPADDNNTQVLIQIPLDNSNDNNNLISSDLDRSNKASPKLFIFISNQKSEAKLISLDIQQCNYNTCPFNQIKVSGCLNVEKISFDVSANRIIGIGGSEYNPSADLEVYSINPLNGQCDPISKISTSGQFLQASAFHSQSSQMLLSLSNGFVIFDLNSKVLTNVTMPQYYGVRPYANVVTVD